MSNPFMHLSKLEIQHEIGVRHNRFERLRSQISATENELEQLEEALSAKVNSDTPTTGRAIASLGTKSVPPAVAGGYDPRHGGQR